MASAGLPPGPRAVHACVVAAAAAGDADGALDAMRRAHAAGLRPLPESYVALIRAFAGVGDAAAARAVLASMARAVPDAREGWLALCAALFRAGLGDDAEAALLRGRRADGWQPDADLFLEWITWLCAERGGRGARIAQFIFDKDMRSAGVEPDIRHANVLLAADSFLLSGHVGEKTLLAIADGAFGPLCRPNADSHAIVMEAHLEAIESAARKAAHRLSGPNKELTRRLEERSEAYLKRLEEFTDATKNKKKGGGSALRRGSAGGGGSDGSDSEPDPEQPKPDLVDEIFDSDPSNFSQRGLDEGGDGVGAGHESLQEAFGLMLRAGIRPNRRVLAAMTRARLWGGADADDWMDCFRRMARLGRPGSRTDALPDGAMAALVERLSDAARPWDLLDVVAAAAGDGRRLPAAAFGPRGVDAERIYLDEEMAAAEVEAYNAAAAAAAAEEEEEEGDWEEDEGEFDDDDDEEEEEEEEEAGVEGPFGDGEGQRRRRRKKQQQQLPVPGPAISADSFLSPIAAWIPKYLAAASAARVPGFKAAVDFKAAGAAAGGGGGWDSASPEDEEALLLAGPAAASSPSSSSPSASSAPSPEGVLIEMLLDARGRPQRRVQLSAGHAGGGGGGGGFEDSRHWVDAGGAVVVAVPGDRDRAAPDDAAAPDAPPAPVASSPASASFSDDVGPGAAATMVPLSKMSRDQLVAELAARGLPFAGMRRGEQYEAVKAARATAKAGRFGGASGLDAVLEKRERAAMAAAARDMAKIRDSASESAEAAVALVAWRKAVWEDGALVEHREFLAPPEGAPGAGEEHWREVIRQPGAALKDKKKKKKPGEDEDGGGDDDEELDAEAIQAKVDELTRDLPVLYRVRDTNEPVRILEMTSKEVNEQAVARLALSGGQRPYEDPSLPYSFQQFWPEGEEPFAPAPPFWPAGAPAAAQLALGLLEAAEACGAPATAADLAALASAAAAADGGGGRELALAVARRLGDGRRLRAMLSPPVVEAVAADLRRATRGGLGGGGAGGGGGDDGASSARAAVEAALVAAGLGPASSHPAPAALALASAAAAAAAAALDGQRTAAERLAQEEEDEEAEDEARRSREEAEAEAVAAAVARAAAERAASPAPRLEGGEVVRSGSPETAAAAGSSSEEEEEEEEEAPADDEEFVEDE